MERFRNWARTQIFLDPDNTSGQPDI